MQTVAVRNKSESKVYATRLNTASPISTLDPGTPIEVPSVQRNASCPCGGGCPHCQSRLPIQTKLNIASFDNNNYKSQAESARHAEGQEILQPSARPGQGSVDRWAVRDQVEAERLARSIESAPPAHGARPLIPLSAPLMQPGVDSLLPPGESPEREDLRPSEQALGFDFSKVRIHRDNDAARACTWIGAKAMTIGHHVYFDHDRYNPKTQSGRSLLQHELAHVAQSSHSSDPLGVLARDRSANVLSNFEFFDGAADHANGLALLLGMNDTDFNDTMASLIRSGGFDRITSRLNQSQNRQLLLALGSRGTPANRDAALAAQPLFDLTGFGSATVYSQQYVGDYGARAPSLASGTRARVVPTGPSSSFTGSGATGVNPQAAPMALSDMEEMRCQAWASTRTSISWTDRLSSGCFTQPPSPTGLGVQHHQYTRTPGFEMLYDWSNPIKGSLAAYTASLTAADLQDQARVLLSQPISTHFASSYAGRLPDRAQLVRAAARRHRLTPQVVAAIIFAEQRDQSVREDAADYAAGTIAHRASTSIGLGQVTGTAVRRHDLFADLASPSLRAVLARPTDVSTSRIATLLASDEFNIFATARYIRIVADIGATKTPAMLPNTMATYPGLNLSLYSQDASQWTEDHVACLGSEYTSAPFDDNLSRGWGEHVRQAFQDVQAAGMF